jgi:hypothetical protein
MSILNPGDRVRVTAKRPVYGYVAGCKGVVHAEPTKDLNGKTYYIVRMDRDDADDVTKFLADEIELDM